MKVTVFLNKRFEWGIFSKNGTQAFIYIKKLASIFRVSNAEFRAASFTLIELLVCIAIIAVLSSMLLPALSKARATGKQIACGSKIKNVGMSFFMYADNFDGCSPPPQGLPTNEGWWGADSWQQYFRHNDYIDQMGSGHSGVGGSNCYRCPSAPDEWPKDNNGYCGHYGYNYSMRLAGHEKFHTVPHQTEIILLVDSCTDWLSLAHGWFFCADYTRAHQRHIGGLNIIYVDGHLKYRKCSQPPRDDYDFLGRSRFYPYDYLNNWR